MGNVTGLKMITGLLLAATVAAAAVVGGLPAAPVQAGNGQQQGAGSGGLPIAYSPPDRGAPVTRIAGTVRGPRSDKPLRVVALAPPQSALTSSPTPALYWFVSADQEESVRAVLTITDEETFDTVLDVSLPGKVTAGIHRIALDVHGAALKPDHEYTWTVAVVRDADHRSSDVVAGGGLIYRSFAGGDPEGSVPERAVSYAASGYWYDALDLLMMARLQNADDAEVAAMERALLQQVALNEVSETR